MTDNAAQYASRRSGWRTPTCQGRPVPGAPLRRTSPPPSIAWSGKPACLEKPGGTFDRPAFYNSARVETAARPSIEKAARCPVELVAERDHLLQFLAALVNWQFAPVKTAHFAVRFVGAERVVDPVQPIGHASQGRVDLDPRRRGAHVKGHDCAHDFFMVDIARCPGHAEGHVMVALSRADWSDWANASLVYVAPETTSKLMP